jgi:hypothetical protein
VASSSFSNSLWPLRFRGSSVELGRGGNRPSMGGRGATVGVVAAMVGLSGSIAIGLAP